MRANREDARSAVALSAHYALRSNGQIDDVTMSFAPDRTRLSHVVAWRDGPNYDKGNPKG